MKLIIRDGYATLNGDKTEYEMQSGSLDIIADDGRTLFDIKLNADGSIDIQPGHVCKHGGVLLDDSFIIQPRSSNLITLIKTEYKE